MSIENQETIPVNSPTILLEENTSRFSTAEWFENIKRKTITLAGVGGIGSHLAFLLSRLNPYNIYLYDSDKVELANMSGQFFCTDNIGKYKTNSIASTINKYSLFNKVVAFNTKYDSECQNTKIMMCGFDNMEARNIFYHNWKKGAISSENKDIRKMYLFIDGRLAAEEFQILCIRGDDSYNMERYEKEFLFTDAEADATTCSYKQTSFCASMIAAYITNLFVNFCANECNILIERDLPFYTEYNAKTMYLKTEA